MFVGFCGCWLYFLLLLAPRYVPDGTPKTCWPVFRIYCCADALAPLFDAARCAALLFASAFKLAMYAARYAGVFIFSTLIDCSFRCFCMMQLNYDRRNVQLLFYRTIFDTTTNISTRWIYRRRRRAANPALLGWGASYLNAANFVVNLFVILSSNDDDDPFSLLLHEIKNDDDTHPHFYCIFYIVLYFISFCILYRFVTHQRDSTAAKSASTHPYYLYETNPRLILLQLIAPTSIPRLHGFSFCDSVPSPS